MVSTERFGCFRKALTITMYVIMGIAVLMGVANFFLKLFGPEKATELTKSLYLPTMGVALLLAGCQVLGVIGVKRDSWPLVLTYTILNGILFLTLVILDIVNFNFFLFIKFPLFGLFTAALVWYLLMLKAIAAMCGGGMPPAGGYGGVGVGAPYGGVAGKQDSDGPKDGIPSDSNAPSKTTRPTSATTGATP